MSEAVHVVGVSCTRFGRHPDRGAGTMARQALSDVLADAGTHLRDVGAVFYANVSQKAVEGQHMIPGQVALRPAGVTGIPVVNVENACAGGATAFWLAVAHVRSGQSPAAVASASTSWSCRTPPRRWRCSTARWTGLTAAPPCGRSTEWPASRTNQESTKVLRIADRCSWTSMRHSPSRT